MYLIAAGEVQHFEMALEDFVIVDVRTSVCFFWWIECIQVNKCTHAIIKYIHFKRNLFIREIYIEDEYYAYLLAQDNFLSVPNQGVEISNVDG